MSGNPFCVQEKAEGHGVIIFGASGDLSFRKLIPTLYNLYKNSRINGGFYILGCARTGYSNDEFRDTVRKSLVRVGKEVDEGFITRCFYHSLDYSLKEDYLSLSKEVLRLEEKHGISSKVFHLATPPSLFTVIAENLASVNLAGKNCGNSCTKIIFEKPFGVDLESASLLDESLHKYLKEEQIYRIDHYLGKETVQNIAMLRFANAFFEPVWNRNYIDSIQITVSESIGIEKRASYFDSSGLLRDMFQNHILQLIALVGMEAPLSFEADRLRDETVKVMRAVRRFDKERISSDIIRAQYRGGVLNGEKLRSYKDEEGVDENSKTETYMAAVFYIDNRRWDEVPIYVRSGKRLSKKKTEIDIIFKKVPHSIFSKDEIGGLNQNILRLIIQPNEGAELLVMVKQPGGKLCMSEVPLRFNYKEAFNIEMPEAYERLLLDCMLSDQSLFWRSDGVEEAWKIFTPILKEWQRNNSLPVYEYEAGGSGPKEADNLLKRDGRQWLAL